MQSPEFKYLINYHVEMTFAKTQKKMPPKEPQIKTSNETEDAYKV